MPFFDKNKTVFHFVLGQLIVHEQSEDVIRSKHIFYEEKEISTSFQIKKAVVKMWKICPRTMAPG